MNWKTKLRSRNLPTEAGWLLYILFLWLKWCLKGRHNIKIEDIRMISCMLNSVWQLLAILVYVNAFWPRAYSAEAVLRIDMLFLVAFPFDTFVRIVSFLVYIYWRHVKWVPFHSGGKCLKSRRFSIQKPNEKNCPMFQRHHTFIFPHFLSI